MQTSLLFVCLACEYDLYIIGSFWSAGEVAEFNRAGIVVHTLLFLKCPRGTFHQKSVARCAKLVHYQLRENQC